MQKNINTTSHQHAGTGIPGLDDVLEGGFRRERVYLIEGNPGTGKTTLALSFLLEGIAQGEKSLYVTLSETKEELIDTAISHGLSLDKIEIFEVVPPETLLNASQRQSLLYSSELELNETINLILEEIERVKPQRLVIDSLSEIRLLAQNSLRYRRQILALKHDFVKSGSTVLLLDDMTTDTLDKTVHSIAHGIIKLEEILMDYGPERRRMRVSKYRGQSYRGGYHDMKIRTGGLVVFPRLIASEHYQNYHRDILTTNIAELDLLAGGGLERGTSVLILGPSGSGKSLLTVCFLMAALKRGEKAAYFLFEEDISLMRARCKLIGFDINPYVENGQLFLQQVDAAELTPGEFAYLVRDTVTQQNVQTVAIDSLNGYEAAMPEERSLVLHMHELLSYLNRKGVLSFLTVAQHGLLGEMRSTVDLTYLSDTVILLRFFEALGHVKRAISVIKKRAGNHEDTIREFKIGNNGIVLGDPLQDFQGVLRGVPQYLGKDSQLMTVGLD